MLLLQRTVMHPDKCTEIKRVVGFIQPRVFAVSCLGEVSTCEREMTCNLALFLLMAGCSAPVPFTWHLPGISLERLVSFSFNCMPRFYYNAVSYLLIHFNKS